MSKLRKPWSGTWVWAFLLAACSLQAHAQVASASQSALAGLGRTATPAEIAAWNIDVRPDFKGLPVGSGTVAKGQQVWETKCASCHGVFGESNQVFTPLTGGVSADDLKTGHVARLKDPSFPSRTILMKLSTLSTLWDYINRAMPWTQPKSLSTEEVYAVTAYVLNLNNVLPDDFTLSDKNIAQVQKRMPNRNGMTTLHAMWPGKELGGTSVPDTHNTACMKDCAPAPQVLSSIPDYARNQHGNLAEQNRLVGEQLGADTTQAPAPTLRANADHAMAQELPEAPVKAPVKVPPKMPAPAAAPDSAGASNSKAALDLTRKYACVACHAIDSRLVGPAFTEVAQKYPGKVDYLAGKIKQGGGGLWGPIPMPAQALSLDEAKTIAQWLASGARK